MNEITNKLLELEQLFNTYHTQYADKINLPNNWVNIYKTFQSHNITIETWNYVASLIQEVLSDSKTSYEFTNGLVKQFFDIIEILNNEYSALDTQVEAILLELQKHSNSLKNNIIATNTAIQDGQVSDAFVMDGTYVLYYGTSTSYNVANKTITGIKLYKTVDRHYRLVYSSFEDANILAKLEKNDETKSIQITSLLSDVEYLKSLSYVAEQDLSQVAFTGNYNDLTNKPTIPTQVSELTNNVGFITNATEDLINYYKKSETYTKDEVLEIVSSLETIKIEFAASLNAITQPKDNIIYFVGTQAPYTEYVYISSENRFEVIGETSIDLSSYVQTSDTLNTNKIVVGNGAKSIKTTDYNVRDYGTSGIMLNSDTDIPTSKLVLNEISKYHAFFTINGDSGNLGATTIASASDYKLIIDENLLVYRRISKQTGNIVYHSQEVIDGTHIRDYYLTFNASGDYVRTFVENVSHAEFDDLVANTPTDIKYNTETKVAYLEHDGTQIGSGAVIDLNGYVPYYDGDTLVLSELEQFTGDVATKEYVDNAIANAGGGMKGAIPVVDELPTTISSDSPSLVSYKGVIYALVDTEE